MTTRSGVTDIATPMTRALSEAGNVAGNLARPPTKRTYIAVSFAA